MSKGSGRLSRAVVLGAFVATLALALSLPSIAFAAMVPVYRFLNLKTGTHFYTAGVAEMINVRDTLGATYRLEGVAYTLDTSNPRNDTPLYRFYNVRNGTHFYTAGAAEMVRVRDTLGATYRLEGVAYYVGLSPAGGSTPVYRFFNRRAGSHFYTAGVAEMINVRDTLAWIFTPEGVGFYINGGATPPVTPVEMPVHQSLQTFCTQVGCHFVSLTLEHNRWPAFATVKCQTCHNSSDPVVINTILAGSDTCTDCHAPMTGHVGTGLAHQLPNLTCTTVVGCHGPNIAALHVNAVSPTNPAQRGCGVCHTNGVVPTNNCLASGCHGPDGPHGVTHEAILSTGSPTCTTASCHGSNAMTIHTLGCAECHASTRAGVPEAIAAGIAGTPATCETCHGVGFAAHPSVPPAPAGHAVSGVCYTSGCHFYTDVSLIHTMGDDPPGCWVCHGATGTKTKTCETVGCHPSITSFHSFTHLDAAGTTPDFKSRACTACHGTDLPTVHTALGCFCHTSSLGFSMAGEMGPLLAAGYGECVDCHKDNYAPHGFNGAASASDPDAGLASGHNTPTFGTVGAFTEFSTLGITDTLGNAPATPMPLPTVDVFWAAGDPNAPAGAITGLDWSSTVKCEDCHSALTGNEAAGPHGGTTFANAGIDPAFPGSFETAYLWGVGAAQKINVTTVTIPGNASGIVNYTPGGATDAQKEELANWQLWMPVDDGNSANKALVSGPATITAGTVICVKCHDLANDGEGLVPAGATAGYGNMPHEHHADRPVVNLGKYEIWNYSTTTSTTVVAESAAAATQTIAPNGGSRVKDIVKAALGREGAGACRDCHVAIPHGWKRPRLIVYSTDPAPYNAGPSVYEGEPITGTNLGSGQMNAISSQITKTYSAPNQPTMPALSAFTETVWNGPVLEPEGYTEWDTTQCNACGHHVTTLFDGSTTTPTHSTRAPYNWSYVTYSNGMWK